MRTIIERAKELLQSYTDPVIGAPDPSFVLQLPDDVYTSSNLFAVQKFFDGNFQFDVFFESASAKQKLDGESRPYSMLEMLEYSCIQLRCSIRVYLPLLPRTMNDSNIYSQSHHHTPPRTLNRWRISQNL
jgi:hypothetical protein